MVHHYTRQCIEKARPLIEAADADSLGYATLQLRMGIEFLFYELIPYYRDELPEDIVTKKWKPQDFIAAIVECDPDFDKLRSITIWSGKSEDTAPQLDVTVPGKKLLKDHYHRLGIYLHAPVDLHDHCQTKWTDTLRSTIQTLEKFCSSRAIGNIRTLVRIDCICGKEIRRNRLGVLATGEMRCLDPKCNAVFDVVLEGTKSRFTLRQTSYVCPYCCTENFVSVGRVCEGLSITCVECEKRVEVQSQLRLAPLDGVPIAVQNTADKERKTDS